MDKKIYNRNLYRFNTGSIGAPEHGTGLLLAAVTHRVNKAEGGWASAIAEPSPHPVPDHHIDFSCPYTQSQPGKNPLPPRVVGLEYKDCDLSWVYLSAFDNHNCVAAFSMLNHGIIVVHVDDGPTEETVEQLVVAGAYQLPLTLFINTSGYGDVDSESIESMQVEIAELCQKFGSTIDKIFHGDLQRAARCICGTCEGCLTVIQLLDHLNALATHLPALIIEQLAQPCLLNVLYPFRINEQPAVQVYVRSGCFDRREMLYVVGGGSGKIGCVGMEMLYRKTDALRPGDIATLLIDGPVAIWVGSGTDLTSHRLYQAVPKYFAAQVYLLPHSDGGRSQPLYYSSTPVIMTGMKQFSCTLEPTEGNKKEKNIPLGEKVHLFIHPDKSAKLPSFQSRQKIFLRLGRKIIGTGQITAL